MVKLAAVSKYWLRARTSSGSTCTTINNAKINVLAVDSLYNVLKNNVKEPAPKFRDVNEILKAVRSSAPTTLRRSARLTSNKLRAKRTKRSVIVSVKSLYQTPERDKNVESCSGGVRRRKSARLFEKRSASLLRPAPVQLRSLANPGRIKRKHICWLYKDTSRSDRQSKDGGRPGQQQHDQYVNNHYRNSAHQDTSRHVLQQLTELGQEDVLQLILEKLPRASLLQAARVCQSWARVCEPAFKEECHCKGWLQPRIPRGATPVFPWRSLYYRHTCRACGKVGEFFVRKTFNGNSQFLLCRNCIRLPDVRDQLVQYSIDLYGVTGKLLVPSRFNMSRNNT